MLMLENIKNKLKISVAALAFFIAASLCVTASSAMAAEVSVAVILSSSIAPYKESLEGYYEGLRERGLVFQTKEFFMDEQADSINIISEIRAYQPDLIHTVGTDATRLIKNSIQDVPVVFSMVLNPVAGGLVESMLSSGNNLTGASMDIPSRLHFSYMQDLKPGIKKIGVIYSEKETGGVVREAKRSAALLGLELVAEAVDGPQGVPRAINRLKSRVDFIWSVADGNVFTRETVKEILIVSLRNKLPLMGLSPAFVKAGALFSLSIYPDKIGRQAAGMTADIVRGKAPASMSIGVPEDGGLVLNKNTLKILGLEPSASILDKARILEP